MVSPPNRNLPEVVSEFIIEMHGVHPELKALNGRVDRLERTAERGLQEVRQEFRDEMRQNTDRLIDTFSRSMEPLINRVLARDNRLNSLEKPQA